MTTAAPHPEETNTENQRNQWLQTLRNAMWERLDDLSVEVWVTPEPVRFEDRESGAYRRLSRGEPWARRLFDCGWFRFRAKIPPGSGEGLALRIDVNGELLVVDSRGNPVRGLTCVASTFDRRLGSPAKTIYRLPPDLASAGSIEVWADAGFNDLFGSVPNGGVIEEATLVRARENVRTLYYDAEVACDWLSVLAHDDPLRSELENAVRNAMAASRDLTADSVTKARTVLRDTLQPTRASSPSAHELRISAIGHAHLDLAWLWPVREGVRKGVRTLATALHLMETYPDYRLGVSQAQLLQWVEKASPHLFKRIQKAVADGRIDLQGAMWVEPDCNIPTGESLVRQILTGRRYFEEKFGYCPRHAWLPDVFGFNGQIPQILRKSGLDYFLTQKLSWNTVNRFPYHSFVWRGIDGSTVLAHMLPEDTYNGPGAPRSVAHIAKNYSERDVSRHALMCFGIGDGGGGPGEEHLERMDRIRHLPESPSVTIRTTAEFFELWREAASKLPTWEGELYLERHQGTFTTQSRTKALHRRCEGLLREAEITGWLAERLGRTTCSRDDLDEAWKCVLLTEFHDIIPGSSIERVYHETVPQLESLVRDLDGRINRGLQQATQSPSGRSQDCLINTLSWPRTDWIESDGRWIRAETPACGWTRIERDEGPGTDFSALKAEERLLENEILRLRFAECGRIESIFDKRAECEILENDAFGNDLVVFPDTGDAWDIPPNYRDNEPERPRLKDTHPTINGPLAAIEQTLTLRNSTLRQRIELRSDEALVRFVTEVDWQEKASMLRVRFPTSIQTPYGTGEIAFGSIRRPTDENTSHTLAQFEKPAHQWVDLSGPDYGVALLNDCKYGNRMKANVIDLNLIRSVPHPGGALINPEDSLSDSPATPYTDIGSHRFTYALLPHVGPLNISDVTARARALNNPIRRVRTSLFTEQTRGSWIELSDPSIELAALKPAENGDGWIARLVNLTSDTRECELRLAFPVKDFQLTDLAESSGTPLPSNNDRTTVNFSPQAVETVRLRF